MICSWVILLYIVKLFNIVCYGVKVFGSCVYLEKYSTKHLSTGISIYFHLGVGPTIIYFKHGHRHHMTFKFFDYQLARANDSLFCVNLCNGFIIALKLCMNLQKYCTKPKNNCTYFTVVGTGHSVKLCTFKPLMYMPSGVTSKQMNAVLLYKKLQFLSLQ